MQCCRSRPEICAQALRAASIRVLKYSTTQTIEYRTQEHTVSTQSSQDLHNKGWGFALFIIILAVAANVTAFSIHKATYLAPPSGDAHAPKAAAH